MVGSRLVSTRSLGRGKRRRRVFVAWFAVGCVGILGCGTSSTVGTGDAPPSLDPSVRPTAVVAGDNEGWIIAPSGSGSGEGTIWHMASDGVTKPVASVKSFPVVSATFFGGHLVVGQGGCLDPGQPMDECQTAHYEMRALDGNGASVWTIDFGDVKQSNSTGGLGIIGRTATELWFFAPDGLEAIDASGHVTEKAPATGQPCVLGDELYESVDGILSGPAGQSLDPSEVNSYQASILMWTGEAWQPRGSISGEVGGATSIECASDGFVAYNLNPVATWTPQGGETKLVPDGTPLAKPPTGPVSPFPTRAGSSGLYRLSSDGSVQRLVSGAWAGTELTLPTPTVGTLPPGFIVDASDTTAIGCVGLPDTATTTPGTAPTINKTVCRIAPIS